MGSKDIDDYGGLVSLEPQPRGGLGPGLGLGLGTGLSRAGRQADDRELVVAAHILAPVLCADRKVSEPIV